MILSKKHRDSILQWIDDSGLSKRAAARELNIAQSAFLRWIGDEDINIHDSKWKILQPKIQDYLEPTPPESTIPDKLKEPYENLKYIYESDKSQFWIAEHFLRNTASVVKDKEFQKRIIPMPSKKSLEVIDADNDQIPDYYISAAAGQGDPDTFILPIPFEQASKMKYERVLVEGESMLPTLKDKSFYYMKKLDIGHIHIPAVVKPEIELQTLRSYIKDNSLVMVNLNQSGRTIKRIQYRVSSTGTYTIFLHADNEEWGKENGFPKAITRKDDLFIYGEIVAKEVDDTPSLKASSFYVLGYFFIELSNKKGILIPKWTILFFIGVIICLLCFIYFRKKVLNYKTLQGFIDICRHKDKQKVTKINAYSYNAQSNDLGFMSRYLIAVKEKNICDRHFK